ncbi:crotonase/enoyl-CoA hydratase family protein [Pseudomonas putida]|uniref:crotonase/enoyl-CoA hydratase family protein n=1 Tax=Pseudomonas putida TaxID=303 RepID=UPI0023636149|nr:crotonase/enoyl-CoA hydratase family protein [Pseudomonas putida]MDD2068689.1 crotonase/enoyl-CoA hydratase family protein [Pseudomonas putida]HDS1738622.1 crotonase/enoyl-CoA hydratase family protein [Pseudomonas putida]
MSDILQCQENDGIVTLTINRPEQRNPVSDMDMIDALCDALERADSDLQTRVVILTGAGSAFSTGGNIHSMQPGGGLVDRSAVRTRYNYRNGIQRLPLLFERLEVPVLAAVNGPAIGAGCDLACMCDIRIASSKAKFAESFVKLGIVPGDGGAWLLPRVVGFSKACELAFTGDVIDAQQALACGLVSQVVEPDQLNDVTLQLARRIAANPGYAVRMTKRLMREARTASLSTILECSAAAQALSHTTSEHADAVAAFLARSAAVPAKA